jgi:hypothetical protein
MIIRAPNIQSFRPKGADASSAGLDTEISDVFTWTFTSRLLRYPNKQQNLMDVSTNVVNLQRYKAPDLYSTDIRFESRHSTAYSETSSS